jgi:predicted enzyme related to lactoylglutathione lyase
MAEVTKHAPGTFCWTELASKNTAAAKKFYQGIFGWKLKEVPMGDAGTYTIFLVDDKDAAAMYELDGKHKNIPPHWGAYISVANADDSVGKIKSAGGKVVEGPFDVMDIGRMAVLQDPTGAHFSVWQPKKHIGARVQELPGTVCWRELLTPNIDAAGKFYSTVFGWKGSAKNMGNFTYHMFENGGEGVGGMMLPPEKEIPPHWITYFLVENCKQTVSKVRSLGGEIYKDTTEIPDMGQFAVIGDPEGASFGIFEVNE